MMLYEVVQGSTASGKSAKDDTQVSFEWWHPGVFWMINRSV